MIQNGQQGQDPRSKQSQQFPMSNKNINRQGPNPSGMNSMNDMPMINSQNNIMKSRMK